MVPLRLFCSGKDFIQQHTLHQQRSFQAFTTIVVNENHLCTYDDLHHLVYDAVTNRN